MISADVKFSGTAQIKNTFYIFHLPILFHKEISAWAGFMLQFMDEMESK